MPFALGAAQCFAAYFVAHDVRGWYWSFAALGFIGFTGYVNAEVNARFNRTHLGEMPAGEVMGPPRRTRPGPATRKPWIKR